MILNINRLFLPDQITHTHAHTHTHTHTLFMAMSASETLTLERKEKKRKDSAGSDDTASMIKGGGYLGVRTQLKRQSIDTINQ